MESASPRSGLASSLRRTAAYFSAMARRSVVDFQNGLLGASDVALLFDVRLDHALGEGDGVDGGLSALQVIPIGISGRLVDSLVRMVELEQESLGVEEGVIQQGLVAVGVMEEASESRVAGALWLGGVHWRAESGEQCAEDYVPRATIRQG